MSYVKATIETLNRQQYLERICSYYLDMLTRCYRELGVN